MTDDSQLMSENQAANAARILLRRREIRRSFRFWCEDYLAQKGESPALHHLKIIETLQAVSDGHIKKVMLLMPPGAAKSTYTSVLFPPWYLNQHPRHLILACSYSYSLIEGFGRSCRDLIDNHHNVLGYGLSKSAAASGDWRTTGGGGYFCAGVNAGIAGHRADLAFIDDYLGTEEEANSEVIREKNWNWYRKDFVPRLKPQAARIIIANRRHEDDLVGRLMNKEKDWTILKFPMLAVEDEPDILGRKPGERLWPEWFTQAQVDEAKSDRTTWGGLYQQDPQDEDGNFFDVNSILTYGPDDLPSNLRPYAASDWAVRKDTENDSFCHLPGGVDEQGRLFILPQWFWGKSDTGAFTDEMFRLQRLLNPISWWHGRENITGAIEPFIKARMREENCYINIEELSEAKDKQAKAASIKARMKAGMVLFPHFHPQWEEARQQLLKFPKGKYDDFVDALAKLGQGLASMMPANKVVVVPEFTALPEQRLTCGYVKNSSARRQRRVNRHAYN